ncbi:MAG: glycosyltransferase family 9 protein [Deferribacteres bacterium]|nr:glycosyltransferase family 9 protein [Deferribacteres bacterium]
MTKRILVINLGGMGDILLSVPALRALRRRYPGARISLLAVPRTVELAGEFDFIDEVISFEFYDEGSRGFMPALNARKLRSLYRLLRGLRMQRFDMALNMRTLVSWAGAVKMALLFRVIGAGHSAGRDTEGRGFFFDTRIRETGAGQKHEMEYDLDLASALGADISERDMGLRIHDKDMAGISRILKDSGIYGDEIIIGVNPGGMHSHRWPLKNFALVMNMLAGRLNCRFVVTGGALERELAGRLEKMLDTRLIDLTGRTTIRELAALIKRCNLYITNDTGPMHIAAALETPLIAIFGPGYLTRFDPRRISGRAVVFHKGAECAPCNKTVCDSLRCFEGISPEEVADASLRLL